MKARTLPALPPVRTRDIYGRRGPPSRCEKKKDAVVSLHPRRTRRELEVKCAAKARGCRQRAGAPDESGTPLSVGLPPCSIGPRRAHPLRRRAASSTFWRRWRRRRSRVVRMEKATRRGISEGTSDTPTLDTHCKFGSDISESRVFKALQCLAPTNTTIWRIQSPQRPTQRLSGWQHLRVTGRGPSRPRPRTPEVRKLSSSCPSQNNTRVHSVWHARSLPLASY